MNHKTHKKCIEMLETVSRLYKVNVSIDYRYRQHTYKSNKDWTIKAMGKSFTNKDFTEACFEAIVFIHNAHDNPQEAKEQTINI